MITKKFNKVISVCALKDSEVWKLSNIKIMENIKSENYIVIVPDNEVKIFQKITSKKYDVVSENLFIDEFIHALISKLPGEKKFQFGWYLQQFIKLSAINSSPKNETVLIWDADTIPIKPLEFFDKDGNLSYYQSNEYHKPYFDTIFRLLSFYRVTDFSFIAQCFPIKAIWMHEFCNYIESIHNMDWVNAILCSINFYESNGFSEYETLGTFIYHRHKSEIRFLENKWCRLGNSLIGHPAFLDYYIANYRKEFDFISFESWDRKKLYFFKVTLPLLALKLFKKNINIF